MLGVQLERANLAEIPCPGGKAIRALALVIHYCTLTAKLVITDN
jgi:hypothetical protein